MKKLLCILTGAAMSAVSFAQTDSYEWLTFTLTDGSEVAVAAENLSINYADGMLSLSSPSVNTTFKVEDLRSMRFMSGASGVSVTETDFSGKAEYFTSAGVSVGIFVSSDEARRALVPGLYIARNGNKSWKILF